MAKGVNPTARRIRIGCLTLGLIVIAVAGLAATMVVVQGRQTPTANPKYVALGSSFAAGAGLGPLQKHSPLLCARSVNGYPQQLARISHLSIVDMSCGGAVTGNLLKGGQFFQGPQIRTIDSRTRLVTITVGGNDIGYVGDLSLLAARKTNTVLGWLTRRLWKGPKTSAERDYEGLERKLLATLSAIHTRAPQATIVIATYPALLPQQGTCRRVGLTAAEADAMRQVGDRLAETTRSAAAKGGAILVDMHRLGRSHDACSTSPWTNGWADVDGAAFHPTRLGAEATAKVISQAIGK